MNIEILQTSEKSYIVKYYATANRESSPYEINGMAKVTGYYLDEKDIRSGIVKHLEDRDPGTKIEIITIESVTLL